MKENKKGVFIFVLHTHIPYVRKKGKWPHGEETLFEAMAECYIPILNALNDLVKEGVKPSLTISLTPILLEQLNDKYLKEEFMEYLKRRISACRKDIKIYTGTGFIKDKTDAKKHKKLAQYYLDYYSNILISFRTKYKKNLIKEFKKLQDKGIIDIITSSATHAYLPLFYSEESINEQLRIGVETYKKYFKVAPKGIWLPECGYRPMVKSETKSYKGFEKVLENFQLEYFFTDAHVFSSSSFNEMTHSLNGRNYTYSYGPNKKDVKSKKLEQREKPTYRPYNVSDSSVSVFARDIDTSHQVWSSEFGYPGDYYYREFHAKDSISGLNYCRITNNDNFFGKDLYDIKMAHDKMKEHASHFSNLVEKKIKGIECEEGTTPSIVSSYDTELFGHWWFEGVDFLKEVLRNLSKSKTVRPLSAAKYIEEYPSEDKITMPESSWGMGGKHEVWLNPETEWVWPIIHSLSGKMKKAVTDFPNARGTKRKILNQALRELLLLHSSDWPFLISTYQAKDYATQRFNEHKQICEDLLAMVYNKKKFSKRELKSIAKILDTDNPFKDLNYKEFGIMDPNLINIVK